MVLNVTVTEPEGPGFVSAYPCDAAPPTASSLNYVAGQTVPNLVTVKVSAQGTVCLFSQRRTHLVADVAGFLSPIRRSTGSPTFSRPSDTFCSVFRIVERCTNARDRAHTFGRQREAPQQEAEMRLRVRRVGVVAALLAATMSIPAAISSPAHAVDQPGGRLQLHPPQRAIDTRDGTGVGVAGPRTDVQLGANLAWRITITDSKAAGQARLHPCGSAASGPIALFSFEAGETQTSTITVDSTATCLTATTPINVIADSIGTVADAPTPTGLQFVALTSTLVAVRVSL